MSLSCLRPGVARAPEPDPTETPSTSVVPPLPFARKAELLRGLAALRQVKLPAQPIALVEGDAKAPITIEEFADFRCPHCYTAYRLTAELLHRWPGRIQVVHRNFPLDGNCNPLVGRKQEGAQSCRGALAVVCAAEQNLFPAVHAGIFELQTTFAPIDEAAVKRVVEYAGGNFEKLARCMGSRSAQESLQVDIEAGKAIGIEATPTLVVQGRLLEPGTPEREVLFHMVDALVYEREGAGAEMDLVRRQAKKSH